MSLTPRPYQLTGRDFLASRTRALLADEMRVGKTPQAILAAHKVGAKSVLVLCPAIAVPHWEREWRKWYAALGAELPPRVDVLSYDRARILWQSQDSGFRSARWDVLIPDEAHFCKNPDAARTQMVYGKGGLGYQTGAIWALSGTPAPKHAGELWPMLRAFGATKLGYDSFCKRYCTGFYGQCSGQWQITGTRQDRIPEVKVMLAPIMLRRTRKEVAPEMPEIDFQFLEVSPGAVDVAAPSDLSDDDLLTWLAAHQNANREDRQEVATAKVEPLADEITFAVENGLLKQTVVFGWHVKPLYAIAQALRVYGVSAQALTGDTTPSAKEYIQQSFREGRLQVICANILAAGTAIDLSAASHGYFLELDWVPGNNMQAANRLVSMDKHEPVTFDVVTWPGSTDDRIQRVLVRRVKEIGQLI